jgi:hypothetical protein
LLKKKDSPTSDDREIFRQLIKIIENLPSEARPGDLEKALGKVLPSNKPERQVLIQILAFCGILQPKKRKGFWLSFANDSKREVPPVSKTDWE